MDDFRQLRDSWRRDLRLQGKTDATIGAYTESADKFTAWARARGLTSVSQVNRGHFKDWLGELLDSVSAQTTVRHYSGVRQWFKWLAAEEEVPGNPTAGIPQPRVPERRTHVPAVEDLRKVLKACSGKSFNDRRDYALILVLADGGPRSGEACGLRLGDIDLDGQVLLVMGKGRRPRGVPIGHKAVAALDRYLRARMRHPWADRTDALWLGQQGPITTSGIRQILIGRSRQAGIAQLHPHALRHYFADAWLRAGGTEGSLMMVTGWRSRQMVDRYGAAVAASRARQAHRELSPGDRL